MTRLRRHSAGYLLIPDGKRGIYEHRQVMETVLGRKLLSSEHVHHKDGNKRNNHPFNLRVVSVQEHRKLHRQTRCKAGHALKGSNVYVRPDNGHRQCVVCKKAIFKRFRVKNPGYLQQWRESSPHRIAKYNVRRNEQRRLERRHD